MLSVQAQRPCRATTLAQSFRGWGIVALLLAAGLEVNLPRPAQALPGQTARDVAAWIQANPTLQPAPGERLVVRKADTAAQRFTFEASIFPPFPSSKPTGSRVIRSESIQLFDMINGITLARLAESLRVVYGVDVSQDYDRARLVYRYPQPAALEGLQQRLTPIQQARSGEIRLGDRFGYWTEVVQTPQGRPYNGEMVVFLKEDLDGLEAQLRQ